MNNKIPVGMLLIAASARAVAPNGSRRLTFLRASRLPNHGSRAFASEATGSVEEWKHAVEGPLSLLKSRIPPSVRLVAVSKLKPAEALRAAYDAGHKVFGENYVQELVEKASSPLLTPLADIRYHFIGTLQSNKAGLLVKGVRNLAMVETVTSIKLATKLNSAVKGAVAEDLRPPGVLSVMIQVNSSGEPQKGGVENAEEAIVLANHIATSCPHLQIAGVMTIGNADYTAGPENFNFLSKCRDSVASSLGVDVSSLELSMGMSGDYLTAIDHGSTNVRVGSTIFGARS